MEKEIRIQKALIIIAAILITISFAAQMAYAKDKLISTTANSVKVALDKRGNEYVRIIIKEERSLQGIEYEDSVAVMCFGQTVKPAKLIEKGMAFKAIVSQREYKGRTSYTALKIIE